MLLATAASALRSALLKTRARGSLWVHPASSTALLPLKIQGGGGTGTGGRSALLILRVCFVVIRGAMLGAVGQI